jgi:putative glycosyltransferase (TIGR04372 family)
MGRDFKNLISQSKTHIIFSEKDNRDGNKFLKKLGIDASDKFVCITDRDSSYLKKYNPNKDYSYHSYRDVDIDNYIKAIRHLIDLGYYIFRMGRVVEKKININNKKVIDYANSSYRSDYLDIFLAANCEFCISSGTGWDAVATHTFRKPCLYTNLVPISNIYTWSKNFLIITKRYVDMISGKELSIQELGNNNIINLDQTKQYNQNNIKLVENTEDEILEALKEFLFRIIHKNKLNEKDALLEISFWKTYMKLTKFNSKTNAQLHGEALSKFGISFLKSSYFQK